MKLLIFGRSGQLAKGLVTALQGEHAFQVTNLGRPDLDLGDFAALKASISEARPEMIINVAAYTAVDEAEANPLEAYRINAEALGIIGDAAAAVDCPVVHISTDYVFDGRKRHPYQPGDPPNPQTVYGASKLAGERALTVTQPRHVIIRTSWLYGAEGGNFVDTILRLGAKCDRLSVIDDQRGCPTTVDDLADTIIAITRRIKIGRSSDWGTFHYCGSGEATWFSFAKAIFEEAAPYGWSIPIVQPTTTAAFNAKAPRPLYSVLDCSDLCEAYGVRQRDWRQGLSSVIARKLSKMCQLQCEM